MSYNALVVQALISSPSDLPSEHYDVITRAIRAWNVTYSKVYGVHFSSTTWTEGGSPGFGEYPQDVLNQQIVDDSDIAIVIFTDRLGTPTPGHPSGTAEEIDRMLKQGKDVAVLLNDCPRAIDRRANDQRQALAEYLGSIQEKAFTGTYNSTEVLYQRMDRLLGQMANKFRRDADSALQTQPPAVADLGSQSPEVEAGVWPRVEFNETANGKRWYLVLESTYNASVREVTFRYEDANGDELRGFDFRNRTPETVDILPPHGIVRFPILQAYGSPSSAMCVVTYIDSAGEEQETRASVRTR